MKTFEIEVSQSVEVTLDETKFTPEFMASFRQTFYDFHDLKDHARHIAQLQARELIGFGGRYFVEGYGPLKDMGISANTTSQWTSVVSSDDDES